jgi:hypothetical protein
MSKKSQRIKLLERAARAALANAIAAQNKLAAAVEAEGEVHLPLFLTAERHRKIVRAQRKDHQAELLRVALMQPALARLAEMAIDTKANEPQRRRDAFRVVGDNDEED